MTTFRRKRINPLVLPESTDLPGALIGALYAFAMDDRDNTAQQPPKSRFLSGRRELIVEDGHGDGDANYGSQYSELVKPRPIFLMSYEPEQESDHDYKPSQTN